MEIKEILELARLGYSKDDIIELSKLKTEDPKDAYSDNDLNDSGDSESGSDTDKQNKVEVDPIEAIIERNKKEKGE